MTCLLRNDFHVAHGYTMADLYDIARCAVRSDFVRPGIEWDERVANAWSAVAAELCRCEEPPRRFDLIIVGRTASTETITQTMRHHGRDNRPATYGEMRVAFERYWTRLPRSPLEDRVVDGVALGQIWPRIPVRQRDALIALALHEDYALAAGSLGVSYDSFCRLVAFGRKTFLRLWHEGEAPSKPWGWDRRKGRDDKGRTAVRVLAHREWRRRRSLASTAEGGTP